MDVEGKMHFIEKAVLRPRRDALMDNTGLESKRNGGNIPEAF
jgi:hypothetical protein